MAQDVSKGRRTEIDFMNGHIVNMGREVGVATPMSAAIVSVVREIDAKQRNRRRTRWSWPFVAPEFDAVNRGATAVFPMYTAVVPSDLCANRTTSPNKTIRPSQCTCGWFFMIHEYELLKGRTR